MGLHHRRSKEFDNDYYSLEKPEIYFFTDIISMGSCVKRKFAKCQLQYFPSEMLSLRRICTTVLESWFYIFLLWIFLDKCYKMLVLRTHLINVHQPARPGCGSWQLYSHYVPWWSCGLGTLRSKIWNSTKKMKSLES